MMASETAKKSAKATAKAKSSKRRSKRRLSSLVSSLYNAAHHALGLIIAVLSDDVAVNRHLWRNDPQSHYQPTIGAMINAQNQKR
jgi:hypothetical protein